MKEKRERKEAVLEKWLAMAHESKIRSLKAEVDVMKLKQIRSFKNDLIVKKPLPLIKHTPNPQYGQGPPYKYDLVEG